MEKTMVTLALIGAVLVLVGLGCFAYVIYLTAGSSVEDRDYLTKHAGFR